MTKRRYVGPLENNGVRPSRTSLEAHGKCLSTVDLTWEIELDCWSTPYARLNMASQAEARDKHPIRYMFPGKRTATLAGCQTAEQVRWGRGKLV